MQTRSKAPPPTDDTLTMASKPPTPPHLSAPYKSVDFFMKMPSMMRHSVITLDATGMNFISWKAQLWDTIDFVTTIKNYLATKRLAEEERYDKVIRSMTCSYLKSNACVRAKVDELDRTGFKWTKDSFLSMQMQLGLPMSGDFTFRNVSTILDTCLRHSQEMKILAHEIEAAIRAKYHQMGSVDTSTMPNLAALHLGNMNRQQTYRIPAHQEQCRTYPVQNHPTQHHPQCTPTHTQGHWATACKLNPDSPNYTGNCAHATTQLRHVGANLADVDRNEFNPEGPLPEGIFMSEGTLMEPWKDDHGMVDTGASHLITNDAGQLTDFRILQKPIPLGVATNAPTSYITG
ncbi:hypothetical protein CROQUDRAFT_91334 [Cronartium quercuum f. sp. fusiforme G11]|uniref:Uncharacterized protein n=1 Tax=Cronartium quercuum f. sp. fusiforme G11 TaxID=708437 RepID=A0A9P6NQA5_9BASI|nr:hypothetical protein CROQUDRAFT_91334 [Cronartium quercuum f. sp. fusiforme G11]